MSYLALLEGIPGFSQAVISLWFRVPQSSVDAAIAAGHALAPAFTYILPFTIPLITFGPALTKKRYRGDVQNVVVYHFDAEPPTPIFDTPSFTSVADDPLSPSYIGLKCSGDGATLSINIQMQDRATISGQQFNRAVVDIYSEFLHEPPPGHAAPGSGWTDGGQTFTTLSDTSYTYNAQPEHFLVEPPQIITPNHWHHLLLSFDLSSPVVTHGPPQLLDPAGSTYSTTAEGTDSYCRLWYAIDDRPYRNGGDDDPFWLNLSPYGVDGGPSDAILTANAYQVANSTTGLPFNCTTAAASCAYSPAAVPAAGFGTPAAAAYTQELYPVELAELQFFSGITLDPAPEAHRRAFIDAAGAPVPPAAAEGLLGKRPVILLHGSSNWTKGANTGGRKMTDPSTGHPILDPAVQFLATGKIDAYSPNPTLLGPQGT